MPGWLIGLLIWAGVASLIAFIVRFCLGTRSQAWEQYGDTIQDFEDPALPNGCLAIVASIVLLPGVITVALFDWIVAPMLFWPGCKIGQIRRSRAFREAVAKLSPFERECYDKILDLRVRREELQNLLVDQENDNDPNTPTPETLKRVNAQIKQLETAENKLWEQVSALPMSDLPAHQLLAKAQQSVCQANELLESANDPTVQLLRGTTVTTPEETKKARAELNQQ